MPFPALEEAEGKVKKLRDDLGEVFKVAGDDYDLKSVLSSSTNPAGCKTTHDVVAWIRETNDELTKASTELDGLKAVERAASAARFAGEPNAETGDDRGAAGGEKHRKSVGDRFVESKAFSDVKGGIGPEMKLDIELKTLMTTTAGFAPEVLRTDRIVEFATRPLQIADVIPQTTTGQSAVQYMEETTYTNAAAEIAEGGTYPESAFVFTEQTNPVRKIGTFVPITEEQLEDAPRMRGYLDNRLPFAVRQRLDGQILTGNGTAPNLRGLLNVVGIQTQAKGADPTPDAVYKAMVKVQVTGQAMPDAVLFNPLDWQGIRLLRTADGIYIWGSPSDAGPERIWGLRAVMAQALTQGTAIVGDFGSYSELAVRRGVDIQVSNSHGTFFVEGKLAVRADIRCAVVFYRPAAFATVTGL